MDRNYLAGAVLMVTVVLSTITWGLAPFVAIAVAGLGSLVTLLVLGIKRAYQLTASEIREAAAMKPTSADAWIFPVTLIITMVVTGGLIFTSDMRSEDGRARMDTRPLASE